MRVLGIIVPPWNLFSIPAPGLLPFPMICFCHFPFAPSGLLSSLISVSLSCKLSLVIFLMDSRLGLALAFPCVILLRFYLSECISVSPLYFSFEFLPLPTPPPPPTPALLQTPFLCPTLEGKLLLQPLHPCNFTQCFRVRPIGGVKVKAYFLS